MATITSNRVWWFEKLGISRDAEDFLESFSLLFRAGVGMNKALLTSIEEIRSSSLKRIIRIIADFVHQGDPLWRACERVGLFDREYIELMRIGEESGRLAENLSFIAQQIQRKRVFRSRTIAAMVYPVIVLVFVVVIGGGVALFLLPRLADVFNQLDIALPFITRVTLMLGEFIRTYWEWVVGVGGSILVVGWYFAFVFSRTKILGDRILFALPGVGRLLREVELARMGYTLGTLLNAGIHVVDALASLERSQTWFLYRRLYRALHERILRGDSFGKIFTTHNAARVIPGSVRQLIVSAEESGTLAETLMTIGERYEEKTQITAKNLSTLLEPLMLFIVWIGVVIVALSVILPIYGLVGELS